MPCASRVPTGAAESTVPSARRAVLPPEPRLHLRIILYAPLLEEVQAAVGTPHARWRDPIRVPVVRTLEISGTRLVVR